MYQFTGFQQILAKRFQCYKIMENTFSKTNSLRYILYLTSVYLGIISGDKWGTFAFRDNADI